MNPLPQHWGCSCGEVLSVCLMNINCIVCKVRARPAPPTSSTLTQRSEVSWSTWEVARPFVSPFVFFVTTLLPQEYLCGEKKNRKIFYSFFLLSVFPRRRHWMFLIALDSSMSLVIICLDEEIFGATGSVLPSLFIIILLKRPRMCSSVLWWILLYLCNCLWRGFVVFMYIWLWIVHTFLLNPINRNRVTALHNLTQVLDHSTLKQIADVRWKPLSSQAFREQLNESNIWYWPNSPHEFPSPGKTGDGFVRSLIPPVRNMLK